MSEASEVIAKPVTSARIVGAARPRVLELLEDEDRRALALHHAVAVERERPAAVLRHHPQALPGLDAAEAEHALAAAGQHHVGLAGADQPHRLAHGVVRRGAGGRHRVARPLQVRRPSRRGSRRRCSSAAAPRRDARGSSPPGRPAGSSRPGSAGRRPRCRAPRPARSAERARRSRAPTAPSPRARRAARTG